MPAKIRTIDVYANPYHALDSDGVPQAVVQMPGSRNYIGAFLDHAKSASEERSVFYFTGEKITVPFTSDIATAVHEGALIAADEAGAKMCGLQGFVDALKQLEAEKALALKKLQAEQGTTATLQPIPTKLASSPEAAAPEPAKEKKVSPNVTLRASSEG